MPGDLCKTQEEAESVADTKRLDAIREGVRAMEIRLFELLQGSTAGKPAECIALEVDRWKKILEEHVQPAR
jgi:hypothetical protein